MELTDIQQILGGSASQKPLPQMSVTGLAYRADAVVPGDVFFCVPGFRHDGHDFAAEAVGRGAVALVVQRLIPGVDVPQFLVPSVRVALSTVAAAFWQHPSSHLAVVGITGTNGKTTTTYLCDAIFRADGRTTGLIGTVETRIGPERMGAGRTTPESADLQRLLAEMRDAGVQAVSMEVSSHAIDLHRVDSVGFAVAAFTNLTQDHLDFHHTLEEYFAVKRRLFTEMEVGARVINVDDPLGASLAEELDSVVTVGIDPVADVRASSVQLAADGARFVLHVGGEALPVHLPLAGAFNVSNALLAAGCAHAMGIDLPTVVRGLEEAPQVPGRLERVDQGQGFAVFVDYAHTPDSLDKAITAVREITPGRVIVVCGAGGDRDPDKRPLMGAAAGGAADHVILTSDNPRSEDPVGIILQIEDGIRDAGASYEIEVDRRSAIMRAIDQAGHGDSVLIAGKGHEDYQIFSDRTVHFDDREVAREELAARC